MRKIVFIMFLIVSLVLMCSLASGNTSNVKNDVYYQVHYISSGDTLWDIANKYSNENTNINSYIDEIMSFNNMKSDKIKAGQNIIVPVHKI